jgi:hypothetical protein
MPGHGKHLLATCGRLHKLVLAARRVANLDHLGVDGRQDLGAPIGRQGRGTDQRVVVGIQQQHRQLLGDDRQRGAVDEHPVLQLAVPFDRASNQHLLAHPLMVLGQHPPEFGQPESLDLLQSLGAAPLFRIRHVRPNVRRLGQSFLLLGHFSQPIGRQPDLGHGLAGLDRSDCSSRVVGQIGDDRIVDAGRGGPLAGGPLEWQRGCPDQRGEEPFVDHDQRWLGNQLLWQGEVFMGHDNQLALEIVELADVTAAMEIRAGSHVAKVVFLPAQ